MNRLLLRAWRKEARRSPLDRATALRTLGIGLLVILPLLGVQVLRRTQLTLHQEQAARSDTLAIMESALLVAERASVDWGHWDDAAQFVAGENPAFKQRALDSAALFDGGIVMLILGSDGQPLLTHAAPAFRLPSYQALIRCSQDNIPRLTTLRSTVRLACRTETGALYLGAISRVTDSDFSPASASSGATMAILDPLLKQESSAAIRQRLAALQRQLLFQPPGPPPPGSRVEAIQPPIHSRHGSLLAIERPSVANVLAEALLEDLPLLGAIPLLMAVLRVMQLLAQRRRRLLQRLADRQANRRIRQACRELDALMEGLGPMQREAPQRSAARPEPPPEPSGEPGAGDSAAPDREAAGAGDALARITARVQRFLHTASNLALLDPLTQLPNRRYFLQQVAEIAATHQRLRRTFAVLFVDIDKFKVINDSYGHAIGDGVLVCVCQRLANRLNPGDFLARYGGDELAVIIDLSTLVDHSSPADCNRVARQRAESLAACMADPVVVGERTIIVSLSIGITLVDPQEEDMGAVIQRSDQAMYQAKRNRLNRIIGPDDLSQAPQLSTYPLFNDLVQAISIRALQVFFQPIGDGRGPWQGMEALARWWHPREGWIPPQEFLELAEQHRQMQTLGPELIRLSLDGFLPLQRIEPGLHLYLNVSPSQLLDPALAASLLQELRQRGLTPDQLVLELTEHSILEPNPCVVENLQRLRTAGMRLALDDFGTGYSSLVLLQTIRPDVLKIDKAFTQSLGHGNETPPILELIAGLAPRMQLDLIAEGIEDPAAMERLRAMGFGLFQGFLLARPASAADWMARLEAPGTSASVPQAIANADPTTETQAEASAQADR